MSKLSPFLYFFQDPATVFAFHLIYTHNIIHWYLVLILFFVYFSMASLVRNFTWSSASKSRGFQRTLAASSFFFWLQLPLLTLISRVVDHSMKYYVQRGLFWIDGLFELRDDPKSYLYYYYSPQLAQLELRFQSLSLPFTLLQEIDLQHSHPNLYAVTKLNGESLYLSAIVCFVPNMKSKPLAIAPNLSLEENKDWLLHKNLDSYLTSYFSKKYASHSWLPQRAFLAAQRGNDSRRFEYICVILPTLIVFIILAHSLSLLYSGSEEITPGLHFTAVGHQWFWSYELEALIKKNYEYVCKDGTCPPPQEASTMLSLSATFDSIPVTESSLNFGGKRLLEVDNPLVLPVGVPLKALATSGDVLHSWAVPEMGIKIDAVPGRINDSISFIQRPGVFYGQCSELCGVGHGFMPIVVEALDVPNFIAWAQQLEA